MKLIPKVNNKISTTRLYSIIPEIQNNEIIKKISVFSGDDIGFPIYMFQYIFTNLHYGKSIYVPNILLFEILLGYVTYGTDRLIDAYAYKKNPSLEIRENKIQLYENIIANENVVMTTLLLSYMLCIQWLSKDKFTSPFSILLLFNAFYKQLKPKLGPLKPVFIGSMWIIASILLPSVAYSHNYEILQDFSSYLPPLLTIIGSSNIADIKDIDEDKEQNINTIPVIIGEEYSHYFTIVVMFISIIIHLNHPNYDFHSIPDVLFDLNNLGIIIGELFKINTLSEDTR